MGAGKSSAAIAMMNEHPEKKFIYVTPFVEETDRIKKSCPSRQFQLPDDKIYGTKRNHLHVLLRDGHNIAMTHELFSRHTAETISLIKNKGYTLVMDEALDVIEMVQIHDSDLQILLEGDCVTIDDGGFIQWVKEEYEDDGAMAKVKELCETGRAHITKYRGKKKAIITIMPPDIFNEFEDVYVLTYLFAGETMKHYFDLYGFETQNIGVSKINGEYHFSDCYDIPDYFGYIKSMIHIYDKKKKLAIETDRFNFSKGWYRKKENKGALDQLRRYSGGYVKDEFCVRNELGRRINNISVKDVMWTCFKDYKEPFELQCGKDGFVACNCRATNEHRHRTHLVYLVNMYYNTFVMNYFRKRSIEVSHDRFALSMMLQWIWRSAIRDGKDIWIYIPSSRMRNLLIDWMDEQERIVAEQRKRKEVV